MSLFDRQLASAYALLGVDAAFSHAGGPATTVRAIVGQQAGSAVDSMVLDTGPELRLQAASAPAGVSRGDTFTIGAKVWRAREDGQPILDGAEIHVPLGR